MTRKTGLVWLLLLFCTAVRASNLRQISSREGISNNAILSLAQDKHGFIWVGSCDGLNMWDGERMRLFPNDWGGETPLSGNLIEEIAVTTDSLFWIRTNYGLDLFDPDSKRVERHADFQGMYKIVTRRSNEVLVVTQDNKFSCYDPAARRFSSVQPMPGIDYADILDMQLDDDGALWVFSRKGIFRIPVAFPDKNNDRIGIGQPERFPTVSNPEYAFAENGSGFFIDENHIFYEFDIRERRLIYIKEMNDEMARMGSVSSIVRDGGDYIVSFYTNGVIRLRTTPEQSVKYATEHINIPCGVFSLLRDARQEIVWIGTDGQGLYQHTRNATAFRSITFNQLPYNLSKPVRALYIDDERTLWVGTKGEGILRIADFYDRKEFTPAHVQQLHGRQQRAARQFGLRLRPQQTQPALDRHRRRRTELLFVRRPAHPHAPHPGAAQIHTRPVRDFARHAVGGHGGLRRIPRDAGRHGVAALDTRGRATAFQRRTGDQELLLHALPRKRLGNVVRQPRRRRGPLRHRRRRQRSLQVRRGAQRHRQRHLRHPPQRRRHHVVRHKRRADRIPAGFDLARSGHPQHRARHSRRPQG